VLILARKLDQRIVVGDSIEIVVVGITDEYIRLGITAPRNVPVYRKELLEQVAAENIAAANTAQLEDEHAAGFLAKGQPTESPDLAILRRGDCPGMAGG